MESALDFSVGFRARKDRAIRAHTYILDGAMSAFRFATLVSLFLNPAVLAVLALIATSGEVPNPTFRWMAIALGPGLPVLFAVYLRASGRVSAIFIPRSRDRIIPLLVASLSCFLAGTLLFRAGASSVPVSLLFGFSLMSAALAAVAAFWHPSLHVAGGAASATAVAFVFPRASGLFWAAVCLVAWSRLKTRSHTIAQVVAGGLIGSTVFLLTHLLMTRML